MQSVCTLFWPTSGVGGVIFSLIHLIGQQNWENEFQRLDGSLIDWWPQFPGGRSKNQLRGGGGIGFCVQLRDPRKADWSQTLSS